MSSSIFRLLQRLCYGRQVKSNLILPHVRQEIEIPDPHPKYKLKKTRNWLLKKLLCIFMFCFKKPVDGKRTSQEDSENCINKSNPEVPICKSTIVDKNVELGNAFEHEREGPCNSESEKDYLSALPAKLRLKIWGFLKTNELVKIRSTCKLFQEDIEQSIGLDLHINETNYNLKVVKKMAHLQKIKVNALCIDDMYSRTISETFLSQIRNVEILGIGPDPVSITNIRSVLKEFPALEEMYFDLDLRDYGEYLSSDYLYQTLDTIFQHEGIEDLKYRIQNWHNQTLRLENMIPPDGWEYVCDFDYKIRLKSLNVYYPGITLHELMKWKTCLRFQSELIHLICNFDSICWIYYQPILKNCARTLVHLELYNLTNHNGYINDTVAFNWNLINALKRLRVLKLHGDSRYYGLRTENMNVWDMGPIEELELKYVDLSMNEICSILDSTWLKVLKLEYFSPIPIPMNIFESSSTGCGSYGSNNFSETNEFIYKLCETLSWRTYNQISLTDYRLPGTSSVLRRRELTNAAELNGYHCSWSPLAEKAFESVEFELDSWQEQE